MPEAELRSASTSSFCLLPFAFCLLPFAFCLSMRDAQSLVTNPNPY